MSKKVASSSPAQHKVIYLQEMPTGGGSDIALKDNISDLPAALTKILALRPVTWQWKDKTVSGRNEYGFIAQETEEILPELVYKDTWVDGTDRKFIATKELVPYLVAATQELQAQIDELRREIASRHKKHTN